MTNVEQLQNAAILKSPDTLTEAQKEAIEKLTPEEVEVLIKIKSKLIGEFPPNTLAAPITHHH